jgi:hypothetical protein
MHFVLY